MRVPRSIAFRLCFASNFFLSYTMPSSISTRKFQMYFKKVAITVLIIYLLTIYLSSNSNHNLSEFCQPSNPLNNSSTNINHLVFGIAGSITTWSYRKVYIETWWKPNVTRGYVFLDKSPTLDLLPWPSSSPPFRVSEDTSKFEVYSEHAMPSIIKIVRMILETFREEDEGVRWYVMTDDDTVIFVENLVEVLARYDHTKYFYIGGHSECVKSNADHSFDMAFGGGGYALSYPLAAALVTNLDECVKRYPDYRIGDRILQSCIADFGVSLTPEKGFHQIDLHGDISGFLSAHPHSPLVSLHHLDIVNPIFPSMNRRKSIKHLMEAAKLDHSRLLQQTICYHKQSNWSFSISWGYSVHIYEKLIPRSLLNRPLETFKPWIENIRRPRYMFNTRWLFNDPCKVPHVFFFESIEEIAGTEIITSYVRASPHGMSACSSQGNHSADHISKVIVFSQKNKHSEIERSECCEIDYMSGKDMAEAKLRACMKDEMVA